MANKVKNTSQLKIVEGFADGDDRTLILDNPRPDVTGAEINAVEAKAIASQVIIGDKAGAAFTGFKSAKIVNVAETTLDISNESGQSALSLK